MASRSRSPRRARARRSVEELVDSTLRTIHVVRVDLHDGLWLEFEAGPVEPGSLMLWFSDEFAVSVDAALSNALILAANGPRTRLSATERVMCREEYQERVDEAGHRGRQPAAPPEPGKNSRARRVR